MALKRKRAVIEKKSVMSNKKISNRKESKCQNCRSKSQQRDKSLRLLSLICEFLFIFQLKEGNEFKEMKNELTIRGPGHCHRRVEGRLT